MLRPATAWITLCALVYGATNTMAGGVEQLDLPTAIAYALERNRELVRAALLTDRSEWDAENARSQFRLRVRPDTHVGFSSERDDLQYGIGAGRQFVWGTSVDIGSHVTRTQPEDEDDIQRTSVLVELRQPLFRNFGRLVNEEPVVQANHQLKEVRRGYEQQQADLVVDVVQTFETLLQLEAQIAADHDFFERADKLFRLTRAREKQGRATRVDTLRVELQRGEAQAQLNAAKERLTFTASSFAERVGFPPDTRFDLVPPPVLDVDLPTTEEAVRIALENRLDYAQVLQDYQDRTRGVRIARRSLYPDISLVSRFERFGEGDNFSQSSSLDQDAWFIGLAANADFNPYRQITSLRAAEVDQVSSEQAIQITEWVIAREVQQEITVYQEAQGNRLHSEHNFDLATRRARLARRLFELGRGDNFSVTDAEEALNRAQLDVLRSRAEASVSGYRLLRTLGTLVDTPEDLRPTAMVHEP